MDSQQISKRVNGHMRKRLSVLFILLMAELFLFGLSAPSQRIYAAENDNEPHVITGSDVKTFLDELLPKQLEEYHIAGAVVSVVKDGKIIYENGYGFYDKDKSKRPDPKSTLFRIGSITKLFTWTAVMQLVEQGKLDPDNDVNDYLKDFKIPETFDRPVTMRNLMTHTTGFDDRLSNLFNPPGSNVIPLGDYLKQTMPERNRAPGENIAYSNYGAALAGFIVEQVSGQGYEDYIRNNILEPLHMDHTILDQFVPELYGGNASLGFRYHGTTFKSRPDALIQLVPAGAISSTASDMAAFMITHLQDGRFGEERILSEEASEEMHSRQVVADDRLPGICLGFMEWNRNGKRILWHSGGTQMFKSLLMMIPEENTGLFVSYNTPASEMARNELRQEFLDRYYPYRGIEPQPMAGYRERAKRYEGTYKEARTAEFNSDKLIFALSRSRKVTANKDGSITFRDTRYIETEPLCFREVNGQGILIFKEDRNGKIAGAYQDFEPHETYSKLPWYLSVDIQMALLAIFLLVFLYAVIGWNIIKRRKRPWYMKDEDALKSGRKSIRYISAVNFLYLFMVCPVMLAGVFTGSPAAYIAVKFFFLLPVASFLLSCFALMKLIEACRHKLWSLTYRIQYGIVLLVSFSYIIWLKFWNLMGFYS